MKKWRRTALATVVVAALALAGAIWQAARSREPVYQGKPLSFWLEQYSGQISGGAFIPNRTKAVREQAATAIRHIGTNAIPWLLALAAVEDSPHQAMDPQRLSSFQQGGCQASGTAVCF